MPKTLKQMFELYEPKAGDEKKFVHKHVVSKTDDANGNGDEVFKGSKVKAVDRKKEAHGYNPGEDEKVYEEAELDIESFILELYAECNEEEKAALEEMLEQDDGVEQLLSLMEEEEGEE